jgi:cell division inhibitor SepF
MSALRKAGVWLGLVEEEDEHFDLDDEFADDDDFAPPARPRPVPRPERADRSERAERADRSEQGRGERGDYRRDAARSRSINDRADRAERERAEFARREPAAAARESAPPRRLAEPRLPEPRFNDWSGGRDEYEEPVEEEAPRERVRQLSRTTPPPPPNSSVTYPTQDNLALAPQVQLRERAVVSEEKGRRYQITTLHPTTFGEARTIGEHFRDGYPVIMNLTELDEPDAKRLVDFAAGLAFGTRGSMERVTNRVFLLSPPNIQVSAEDKAKIAETGFFDQG